MTPEHGNKKHRSTGRDLLTISVELPSRAELLRDGQLVYDGWRLGHSAIYEWRGRQWSVPPRRGRPIAVLKYCEEST